MHRLTLDQITKKLQKREISSHEITEAFLHRIGETEERVGAFLTLDHEGALRSAKDADKKLSSRDNVTALTGVPLALKDIFCTRGLRTTCGSKILDNFIPPYDSTVAAKLKESGAIFLGKNNMDEFAMGSSTENSAYHLTRNPWNLARVPGGSSGGSAAAVASSECCASIGTDTGGSIRQPAAFCGVVGLKPTYGRVSRYGMVAFASSLDQAGPLTKDVTDAAILLQHIAGQDSLDATSSSLPVPDYRSCLKDEVRGLRIGIPREYFAEKIDSEVDEAVQKGIKVLSDAGAEVVDIELPHTRHAVSVYYLVATAEASSNLARYDGIRYGVSTGRRECLNDLYRETRDSGFGDEVKRRIMLGTYALSAGYYDAYYKKASLVRKIIRNDFCEAFVKCDLIVTPTSPSPAFAIGEKSSEPLTMYLSDIFTISCNLAGLPAISIPCGFTMDGLPIGLQIIGQPFNEQNVLRTAYTYEQATDWHTMRPIL